MSDVVCQICGGTEFQVQEGFHYCRTCLTQSQQHGVQMELDRDVTFNQTLTASSKRAISKKKRRKKIHYSSFTSLDALTFILRGWTDEAELLGIAGPSFKPLLKHILFLYLSKVGRAFPKKGTEPSLGVRPHFRDIQVALTGRSKLCLRTRSPEKKHMEEQMEMEENSEDTRKERRRRKRQRNVYLRSLLSESNDDLTTEGDSFSGANSDATVEELDPLKAEDKELYRARNKAIQFSWNTLNKRKWFQRGYLDVYHVSLIKFFAIFSLALLTQNRSQVTLGDIIHLTQCGSISLAAAGTHLPPSMVCQGIGDFMAFSYPNVHDLYRPLRTWIVRISKLIGLGVMDFGSPLHYERRKDEFLIRRYGRFQVPLLERYVKELALPQTLARTIQIAFKHTIFLEELKSNPKGTCPDVSQRVLALILIALKYMYGLDDFTENYISSSFMHVNKDLPLEKQRFVIRDWIRLSRFRVFLMMKYSPTFHSKFVHLMPRTRMTHATYISEVRNGCDLIKRLRRGMPGVYGASDAVFKRFDEFALRTFGEYLPPPSGLYIGETLSPMLKFAEDAIKGKDLGHESLDSLPQESKDKMQQLIDMNKMKLGMRKSTTQEEDTMEVDLPILESTNLGYMLDTKSSAPKFESTEFKKLRDVDRSFVFRARHYRLSPFTARTSSCKDRIISEEEDHENKCLSELPDSYTWILKYFSAYIGTHPHILHSEVCFIESSLLNIDGSFFGKQVAKMKPKGSECVTQDKANAVIEFILEKYVHGYKPQST